MVATNAHYRDPYGDDNSFRAELWGLKWLDGTVREGKMPVNETDCHSMVAGCMSHGRSRLNESHHQTGGHLQLRGHSDGDCFCQGESCGSAAAKRYHLARFWEQPELPRRHHAKSG